MATKKVKSYTCKSCGKTSEKIGVTSLCRQNLHIASDDWTDLEVGETLHGFCLECSAEIPADVMKKILKGGVMAPDYQALLSKLVRNAQVECHTVKGYLDGSASVNLILLNKARTALGLQPKGKNIT
jgi:hypothetical protein